MKSQKANNFLASGRSPTLRPLPIQPLKFQVGTQMNYHPVCHVDNVLRMGLCETNDTPFLKAGTNESTFRVISFTNHVAHMHSNYSTVSAKVRVACSPCEFLDLQSIIHVSIADLLPLFRSLY